MFASVVIPNWNGWRFLPTCLDALRAQTHRDFETIVVDNGSQDGSIAGVQQRYPEVRIVALSANRGFAAAVNAGICAARGEVIALLNNDTEAGPRWLAELCLALAEHPEVSFCAAKMLLFDRRDVINSAGDYYGRDGLPGNRGVWRMDNGSFSRPELVFGACGGAALYRRALFEDIGLFDEEFFAYCEDVDLSFRAQLAGHKCLFVPGAIVYHRLSATGGGPVASYLCGRNFITVLVKNVPRGMLRRHWPAMLAAQLRLAAQAIWHSREPAARARLRGQLAGLWQLPATLRKRRAVQALRRVSDDYIESILQ